MQPTEMATVSVHTKAAALLCVQTALQVITEHWKPLLVDPAMCTSYALHVVRIVHPDTHKQGQFTTHHQHGCCNTTTTPSNSRAGSQSMAVAPMLTGVDI
jgi:hypothetical protein